MAIAPIRHTRLSDLRLRFPYASPFSSVSCPKNAVAVRMAEPLRSPRVVTVKTTAAIARERFDASALLWVALVGELVAAVTLLASGNVPPVLLRSLQLFLRF